MIANIEHMHESVKHCTFRDTKEIIHGYKAVAKTREKGRDIEIVDIRCYMARSPSASVVYCAAWIRANGRYAYGVGRAGGCGYHRRSAAIGDAIADAGIALSQSIGGVGESAERCAIRAICEALGYTEADYILVEFYA